MDWLPQPIYKSDSGTLNDLDGIEAGHDQPPVGRGGRLPDFGCQEVQHGVGDHVVEEENLFNDGLVHRDVINGADQVLSGTNQIC